MLLHTYVHISGGEKGIPAGDNRYVGGGEDSSSDSNVLSTSVGTMRLLPVVVLTGGGGWWCRRSEMLRILLLSLVCTVPGSVATVLSPSSRNVAFLAALLVAYWKVDAKECMKPLLDDADCGFLQIAVAGKVSRSRSALPELSPLFCRLLPPAGLATLGGLRMCMWWPSCALWLPLPALAAEDW